jgi:hypothetical protein
MTYDQTLLLTVIDKLIIGVLLLIFGFWISRSLERFKANEALKAAFAPLRATKYQELWSKTELLSPTNPDVTQPQRKQLHDSLKQWYYDSGGAMVLSLNAADLFLKAQKSLLKPEITSEEIVTIFSGLRTELKIDLGVYRPAERNVQIGGKNQAPNLPMQRTAGRSGV